MALTTSNKSAAIFVAVLAVILSLIQNYFPPSEIYFATGTCTCCLVFFAAIADPETFYETIFAMVPFLRSVMPKSIYAHIQKSIDCLQEGERRVADMKEKQKESTDTDYVVSTQMLLEEIRKRMQWRFVLPAIASGTFVKIIDYEKPKVVGQMMDAVVKEGATMDTAFWPFLRQLVLFVIFDFIFISMREYYTHAAAHRYQANVSTDFISNLLDQEADFIHSDRYSAGVVHLMNRETHRMQKIINQSLQKLIFALISSVGGIYTLYSVDARLALLGILVKSPILATLQQLSRKDIVSELQFKSCLLFSCLNVRRCSFGH